MRRIEDSPSLRARVLGARAIHPQEARRAMAGYQPAAVNGEGEAAAGAACAAGERSEREERREDDRGDEQRPPPRGQCAASSHRVCCIGRPTRRG